MRTERLELRLSPFEKVAWIEAARAAGSPLSEWVRDRMNEASGYVPPEVEEFVRNMEVGFAVNAIDPNQSMTFGLMESKESSTAPGGGAVEIHSTAEGYAVGGGKGLPLELCVGCKRALRVGQRPVEGCKECGK